MKNLLVEYCEISGKSQEEAARVPLAEMQQVVATKQTAQLPEEVVPDRTMPDPAQWSAPVELPVGVGKTMSGFNPELSLLRRLTPKVSHELSNLKRTVPWITLKSYCEVALQTTNLTGWTVTALEQNGLAITWEHCLIEVSALYSSLSQQHPPLFQIKLFGTHEKHETPLAVEFKRHYTGLACACANLLNNFVVRRAINAMEVEWATESAAANADAELFDPEQAPFDRGEAIAEELAQLDHEEPTEP